MFKRSPVIPLLASLAAYFSLWILVPRATFLVALLKSTTSVGVHAHGPFRLLLFLCATLIISIPTIAFMAVQTSVVYFFAKLKMNGWQSALTLLGCLAGIALVVTTMIWHLGVVAKLHRYPTMREIWFIVGMYHPSLLKMLMYAILLLTAASIGYLVSLRIKDRNLLLPVVIFAACTDFWTVTVGPVASIVKHAPEVVNAVSTPIPKAGTGAFVPAVMMGMGDPLFMALVFAAIHRLGMNGRRNYWFVFGFMTLAMIAVLVGIVPFLPALTALAVAIVAANWGEFKLTKQEKISTAIVAVVLIGTIPLIWFGLRPRAKPQPMPAPKPAAASPLEKAPR